MNTFTSTLVALCFAAPAFAQSSSGGIVVQVPGVQVSGSGVDAGVRLGGKEVVGVGVGVTNPPAPAVSPKTTLPDMFMAMEQNLSAALAGLNAILANPQHTPAQVAAQQALIETLRSLKASMGAAITPAAGGSTTGG